MIPTINRKKTIKVRERHPNPTATAGETGPIYYPIAFRPGPMGKSGSFRWPNDETRKVAHATDACPRGSSICLRTGGKQRYSITVSNPFFQKGKLWVYVAGLKYPVQFAFVRIVKELPPLQIET